MAVNRREAQDFAAYVRGDHKDQQAYRDFVLKRLRVASATARLLVHEVDLIGCALDSGAIGPDQAIAEFEQLKADWLIKDKKANDNGSDF